MEILLESFLDNADSAKSPIHLRYLGKEVEPENAWWDTVKANMPSAGENEGGSGKSIIIIRRPYSFLAPVITSMFEEAKDVRVIVDRRFHDRRQTFNSSVQVERRRGTKDRRRSSPMLDVLINVDA